MKPWVGVSSVGLLGVLLLSACGKSSHDLPDDAVGGAGAGSAGGTPAEIDDGGEPSKDAPKPDLPRPDEPPDIAAEIALIAGRSFEVKQGPGRDEDAARDGDCSEYTDTMGPFLSDATYHFEKSAEGGLEVVVSIAMPWLHVERVRLERTLGGWRAAAPLVTGVCLGSVFEEEIGLAFRTPERLTFGFDGVEAGEAPTTLTVDAIFEQQRVHEDEAEVIVLTGNGVLDTVKPRLFRTPALIAYEDKLNEQTTYLTDHHFPWDEQRFFFSEALRPGWSVTVQDEQSHVFETISSSDADVASVTVAGYYPPSYHLTAQGQDLAGNAFEEVVPFPGPELAQSDGQFETTTPMASYYRQYGQGYGGIGTTSPSSSVPDHPEIVALAGQSSLLLESTAFLRIARVEGASVVRFEARLLSGAPAALQVGTMALDAGTPAGVVYRDPTLTPLESDPTSEVRSVTVPIPEGAGDVLVAIQGPRTDLALHDEGDALWLDSLRTE